MIDENDGPPCQVPNPKRISDADAYDIAADTIRAARRCGCLLLVFVFPTGLVRKARAGTEAERSYLKRWPDSFVGAYRSDADPARIAEDILECERVA